MKLIRIFTAVLIMAATFTACSKDKKDTPEAPASVSILGKWEGKLGSGNAIPTGYFGLQIKDNGKIDRISTGGEVSGTGTWTLNNTAFKAEYTADNGVVVKISATFDKLLGKLTGGEWENSVDNGGTWYANKK